MLRQKGLGQNAIMVGYAVATIRAETGLFAPIDEQQADANTSSPDRPFGKYDQPKLTPDGHARMLKDAKGKPRYDAKGRPVYNELGNNPNLKGTADEADLNKWNFYRAWGHLPDSPMLDSPVRQRLAVSLGPKHAPIPLVDYRDGERFHGRGFIQLTGRYNYEAASGYVGADLINDPDKANDPQIAAKLVGWFLTRPGRVAKIERCLTTKVVQVWFHTVAWRDYGGARAVVNGSPPHGVQEFTTAYEEAEKILDVKKLALQTTARAARDSLPIM